MHNSILSILLILATLFLLVSAWNVFKDAANYEPVTHLITDDDFEHFLHNIKEITGVAAAEMMNKVRDRFVNRKLASLGIFTETFMAIDDLSKGTDGDMRSSFLGKLLPIIAPVSLYPKYWKDLPKDIVDELEMLSEMHERTGEPKEDL